MPFPAAAPRSGKAGYDLAAKLSPFVRAGLEHWRGPWFIEKAIILDYLLVYIVSGTGRFSVGPKTFDVGPGDLIWIPPDTYLDLSGRNPEIVPSLGVALSLLLPMIGLTILVSILTLLGTLLLIVPGIIVYLMLSVAVPALVEERRGVVASMKRSRALTAGSKGQIFLLMLLFGIVYVVIVMVIGVLFAAIGTADLTVAAIGQAVSAGVFSLLLAAMLASLYVELRTVKEGATMEALAAIFE